MQKEACMEKYEAQMKYFVVEMIKQCWDSDGEPVDVRSDFPLAYITEKNIGETEEEQLLLKELFLQAIEQDEHITYDRKRHVIQLIDFMG